MKLSKLPGLISRVVRQRGSARLSGGLAMRYTKHNKKDGTLSLSRKEVPPSATEVLVVMDTMTEALPPHEAAADNEIFESDGNFIVRIYVKWRRVH